MPDACRVTDYVILALTVAAILYNVVAVVLGGADASISARLQLHATRFPIIPAALGGLLAHLFWPVRDIH